jgi:hypothetical protein
MPGTSEAVSQAARLSEIGFPEFTTKLITDVFDALVASNLRQTEAYIELLKQTGKSLTQFINDTKDDIGGELLLQFLAHVLPPKDETSEDPSLIKVGNTLDNDDATALNNALAVPDAGLPDDNKVATSGALDEAKVNAILEAVANRISASKYEMLKEMVKQGILRLVVEDGEIETRLTFNTYGSTFYQSNTSDYQRKNFAFRAKAKTGGLLSSWVKASASTSYNSVKVSTANKTDQDRSGSRVQIYGRVFVKFKTDYLPLDQ